MSIAVSAIILPSRILACMLAFMFAIANAAIGYSGYCAEISKIYLLIIVLVSSSLSLHVILRYYRRQQAVQLDISDSGDIIFRVLGVKSSHFDSLNVKLSEKSTLWPQLMLLSLCTVDGQTFMVPILPDSVDTVTFRKLSVALNWLAMHASTRSIFAKNMPSGNF